MDKKSFEKIRIIANRLSPPSNAEAWQIVFKKQFYPFKSCDLCNRIALRLLDL